MSPLRGALIGMPRMWRSWPKQTFGIGGEACGGFSLAILFVPFWGFSGA